MKLVDKIKNLFLDEEEYEIEDDEEDFPQFEEKKKEKRKNLRKEEEVKIEEKVVAKDELPKVMRDTIKKEEKDNLKLDELVKKKDETKEFNEQQPKKFNFPIDLNDDFPSRTNTLDKKMSDVNVQRENVNVLKLEKKVPEKVSEMYSHREIQKEKPKFKASPVISPVYGVLDKNYKKDEVKERSDDLVGMKRPSKKVDFETVRKKAFGNLTDEIKDNMLCENCELYKEAKRINALKEDDLLYDMTVDDKKDITIEKAYDDYEEFGVAYEPKLEKIPEKEDNVVTENVDILINNQDKEDEIEFPVNESVQVEEPISEEEIPSRQSKKKETKVDEDFFELIDSMYKERVDE